MCFTCPGLHSGETHWHRSETTWKQNLMQTTCAPAPCLYLSLARKILQSNCIVHVFVKHLLRTLQHTTLGTTSVLVGTTSTTSSWLGHPAVLECWKILSYLSYNNRNAMKRVKLRLDESSKDTWWYTCLYMFTWRRSFAFSLWMAFLLRSSSICLKKLW